MAVTQKDRRKDAEAQRSAKASRAENGAQVTTHLPHYVGDRLAVVDVHHGRLPPAVGVHSYQVLRANRSHPEWADGFGWTYNHAPMLAHWQGRFWLEYLSNPVHEHGAPGQSLLTSSPDGIHWEQPQVVFPVYRVPPGVDRDAHGVTTPPDLDAVMHQRMGFYVALDGRLLVLGFYGICPDLRTMPNDGRGIGRAVREVYPDGTLGPLHFLRYNRHAGWHEGNTHFPFYRQSPDTGFVAACDALLADRLVTLQWWEEDRSQDGFYAVEGGKALSYYHLPDGHVAGLWKWSQVAVSQDEGRTWSPMTTSPTLVMAGSKVWGQRTSDGRYALVYNPTPDNQHRWPLAVVTADDGLAFDDLLLVNGEAPPRRFPGQYKDFGLNYVRGIVEGNGTPPDGDLWITYSANKEDIWVTRVAVPVRGRGDRQVHDSFDDMAVGQHVPGWNVYSPLWAPVSIAELDGAGEHALELRDRDPYDYARAERVFAAAVQMTVRLRVRAGQADHGRLFIQLADPAGSVPLRIVLDGEAGAIRAQNGGHLRAVAPLAAGQWTVIELRIDAATFRYDLAVDGASLLAGAYFAAPVHALSRLILQTGPNRTEPNLDSEVSGGLDLPGADEPVAEAVYHVRELSIASNVGTLAG